jgi:hypothetical protein
MHILQPIVSETADELHDRLGPSREVSYALCLGVYNIIVAQRSDRRENRRYAIIESRLGNDVLECKINFYTQWPVPQEEHSVNLYDPGSIEEIIDWLAWEIDEGLKRGRNGREKRIRPRPKSKKSRPYKLRRAPDWARLPVLEKPEPTEPTGPQKQLSIRWPTHHQPKLFE